MRNKYLLLRHGESVFNKELRYQGWSKNVPLTEYGRHQVESRINLVKKFNPDIIIASPVMRTRQTAQIFASALKKDVLFSKLIIDFRRSEAMEGKLQEEYAGSKEYIEWLKKSEEDWDFKLSDGESYNGFNDRVKEFLTFIDNRCNKKKILIVTHGDVIRVIIKVKTGIELQRKDVMNVFACELSLARKKAEVYKFREIK